MAQLGPCGETAAQTDPAANYPSRIIKLMVGFAASSGNDIIARTVGQKLQDIFGRTVIVENKPGGGGSLTVLAVMAAPPDGHTLLIGASGAMSIVPAISVSPLIRRSKILRRFPIWCRSHSFFPSTRRIRQGA